MNARPWKLAACVAMVHAVAAGAADAPLSQQITRAGQQAASAGSAEFFTGRVRVEPVWPADPHITASGGLVTFEPGARSAWHTHPAGQRLVVLSGVGLTQEWGKPVQTIRPGDVVWCPPGVKHWHGATPTTTMSHLAVTGTADGRNVNWMEKVSDAQYSQEKTMSDTHHLSATQQAIAPIAAATAVGDMPKLNAALNSGLDAGLTVSDAKEILVQMYAYTGFPRSLNALGELMKVVDARKQRGVQDAPGREPGQPIPVGKELLALGTANQTKLSGAPVRGALFDFAPAIDAYLKTHLFGDIFARDNLDWQSRELATIGALSALPGAESQLQSHIRIGMNVGLTAAQLRQLAQGLAEQDQPQAAARASSAIDTHLAQASAAEPARSPPRQASPAYRGS